MQVQPSMRVREGVGVRVRVCMLCEPRTLLIYAGAGIYGCGCGSTSVCGLKLLAYEALSY
jgi:hypothetical protein